MSKENPDFTRAIYEQPIFVAGYVRERDMREQMFPVLDKFASTLPAGGRVIDIGCGTGDEAYRFADLGFQVTGVDYSSSMIRAAIAQNKGFSSVPNFSTVDARRLGTQFPSCSFDAAWANTSLMHVPPPEMGTTLEGMAHILAPQGKGYIGLRKGHGAELIKEKSME